MRLGRRTLLDKPLVGAPLVLLEQWAGPHGRPIGESIRKPARTAPAERSGGMAGTKCAISAAKLSSERYHFVIEIGVVRMVDRGG